MTRETARRCYSGIHGTCDDCDTSGSCLCSSLTSGLTDLLSMDRRRWGDIIYVCPTFDPVITFLWALGLIASVFAAVVSIYGFVSHMQATHTQQVHSLNERPRRILALLVWSAMCAAGLCICKLCRPTMLLGIDIALSLLFWGELSSDFFVGAEHITHVLAVALRSQLSTFGQTYIDEAIAKEAKQMYLLASTASAFYAVSVLGAVLSSTGYDSMSLQTGIMLTTNLGAAVVVCVGVLRFWLRMQALQASFRKSIAALEASYFIASGGCSPSTIERISTAADASPTTRRSLSSPCLQSLEDEIAQLRRSAKRCKWHARQMSAEMLGTRLIICVFCAIPFLWNKYTYLLALNTCLDRFCLTVEVAATYVPRLPWRSSELRQGAQTRLRVVAVSDRLSSRRLEVAV